MQSKLLTVAQAAELRGVSKQCVIKWIKAGLTAERIGNQFLIKSADLGRYEPRPRGRVAKIK